MSVDQVIKLRYFDRKIIEPYIDSLFPEQKWDIDVRQTCPLNTTKRPLILHRPSMASTTSSYLQN